MLGYVKGPLTVPARPTLLRLSIEEPAGTRLNKRLLSETRSLEKTYHVLLDVDTETKGM